MPATFGRYFVEAPGNTILAAHWNGEFDNILTNLDPTGVGSDSPNLAGYQALESPGDVGTESIPAALRGEIRRLRWMIQKITGGAQWYSSFTSNLISGFSRAQIQKIAWASVPVAGTWKITFNGQQTGVIQYNDVAATIQTLIQALSTVGSGKAFVTGDYTNGFIVLFNVNPGADEPALTISQNSTSVATTVTAPIASADNTLLKIDSNTGKLQSTGISIDDLNNLVLGGTSSLGVANSNLDLILNTFTHFRPATDQGATLGTVAVKWGSLGLGTNVGSGTPAANFLFADLMPKAWTFTASNGTINASVNLTCSKGVTGIYNYSFKTNLASANFSVGSTLNTLGFKAVSNKTTSGFTITTQNTSAANTDIAHDLIIMGTQ